MAAAAGLTSLALTGCAGRVEDGLLPRGVTQGAERVTTSGSGPGSPRSSWARSCGA